MHEAGVARRILEVALTRAAAAGATSIRAVELEVGDPPDLDVDALAMHWPLVAAGTAAAGSTLHVIPSDAPVRSRLVAIEVDPVPGDVPVR